MISLAGKAGVSSKRYPPMSIKCHRVFFFFFSFLISKENITKAPKVDITQEHVACSLPHDRKQE